jgi:predicted Zn-dependent protease
VLAAGCAAPPAVQQNEDFHSAEDERHLWQRVQKEQDIIDNSGLLYHEPELDDYLSRIVKKLQAHSVEPDFQIQIKVLKDPKFNALAYPNGVIYIHTGILARMDNEAQLAALISHEMTHCTHRHSLKIIRSIRDRPAYIAAVQDTLARLSAARLLGATGSVAVASRYNRELETEADRVGLDLMAKANYDTSQAVKLLEYLKQEIETGEIEESFYFGTHPDIRQRIANVKKWLAANKNEKHAAYKNRAEFQARLQRVALNNARLDLRRGRFELARKTVVRYLKNRPEDARAFYLLGEIFRQRDNLNDAGIAAQYYTKAISLNPTYPEPHRALGIIHYKNGAKLMAKKFFESCLLLSPNAHDKAYIQEYLKNCRISSGEKS